MATTSAPARAMLVAILCGSLWWTLPSRAADAAPADDAEPGVMASAREGLRVGTEWLARGVDSWFGDKPFDEGGKVSHGRLSVGLLKREGEGVDTSVRFNARFRLPNVERRAYLFLGRDDEREIITDQPGALTRSEQLQRERADDQRFFAGIGLDLLEDVDFRLGFRGGIKPYAQVRWRRPWQLDEARRVELRQTVFWSLDDRLGATTAVSYDRALSPVLAARLLAAGTVTQDSGTLEWSGLAGLHRRFGDLRVLSLEAVIQGRLDKGGASDMGLRTRWEQPLHRDWVIGELLVGHFWPRQEATGERRAAWALGGRVEVHF